MTWAQAQISAPGAVGGEPLAPGKALSFVIHGPPVTKKNSARIARRKDGTPFVLPSSQAAKWSRIAIQQLIVQKPRGLWPAIAVPVNCRALVYRERRVGDLLNYLQAIADALEDAGVVVDDKLCVAWDGSRLMHDKLRPRVEITLAPFEEGIRQA